MRRAVRKHARAFAALSALVLIALAVSAYILGNERLTAPSWVPFIGRSFYTVNAEFTTAQAVVPGQGQTVDIAGVPVGEIGGVQLHDGVASVKLQIRTKYAPIYRDARLLLRPKTALKDMVIELDPGTRSAGAVPSGATLPVANTAPDVNTDEILSALDADTRAYLEILVNSGAQAFAHRTNAADLRQTFKRFDPTNRDFAQITGELSKRRANVAHVVHDLQLLTGELGKRDRQISSLVTAANTNFRAIASQDTNLRASLRLLPGTLSTAQTTLGKVQTFAGQLGPTLQDLRPTARALGPALAATRPFLVDTTPIIQNHLRPFARIARQPVRALRRAAVNLGPLTPNLVRVYRVVNYLLDELAYKPKGPQQAYLFWASWVNHAGATIFNTQDAHGPIRRGLVVASCTSLQLLEQAILGDPQLKTLYELLAPPASSKVCPSGPAPLKGHPAAKAGRKAPGSKSAGTRPSTKPAPFAPLLRQLPNLGLPQVLESRSRTFGAIL
ncbi:MAG: MCE family protein [Actinobacteria bacterium]|nr:MCE family protein [Actinomycetota bacterium]